MKLGFVVFVCVFSISVACSTASAEKADDQQMAREAMSPFFGARISAGEKQARIQERHASVRTRAGNTPEREISVVIVFNTGLSVARVNALASRYKLEVVDMSLKAPYNDKGVVQSFEVGSAELARYKGGFVARANKAIGAIRYQLITMAETMPPDVSAAYMEIAKNDILAYRIEAYGRSVDMADLVDHSDTALVVAEQVDRGDRKIENHKRMRARAIEAWKRIPPGNATVTRRRVEN